jgi:mRNA interferase MazF
MDYKRGDIYLVNFNPQKKAVEVGKVRPAVIVSDSDLNTILDLIIVVPLTTNLIDDAEPLRIRVTAREKLKQESDIMLEQLRAISKERVYEKVATLYPKELQKVDFGIKKILSI